jgi:C_GCAxxG_C_C family probable redox protein
MSKASQAATLLADSKTNCAQSVLSVFTQELGIDPATALKISLPFGAGMGRTGGMCGAVSAAYMVLGLRAYPDLTPAERKEKVYSLVKEFNQKFTALHDSVNCSALLGCNLSQPEGLAAARERKLFITACPKFVADAVTILEEME